MRGDGGREETGSEGDGRRLGLRGDGRRLGVRGERDCDCEMGWVETMTKSTAADCILSLRTCKFKKTEHRFYSDRKFYFPPSSS